MTTPDWTSAAVDRLLALHAKLDGEAAARLLARTSKPDLERLVMVLARELAKARAQKPD